MNNPNASTDIEWLKTQISKMIQSGWFLDDLSIGSAEAPFITRIEAVKKVAPILGKNAPKLLGTKQ